MKRTHSLLIFLLCTFLISITCLTPLPIAGSQSNQNKSSIGISSYGTISLSPTPTPTPTPSPTPTPTPQGNNIAVIPSYWNDPNAWGLRSGGYCYYPVTWQGQTAIKMSPNPDYISFVESYGWMGLNEMNGYQTPVNPGDHIIFKAWIWVEPSTVGGGGGGCSMGIDIYGANGRICELEGTNGIPDTSSSAPGRMYVSWGSNGWVQLTMDFIVQSQYAADSSNIYSGYTAGQLITPTKFVACFGLLNYVSYNEGASAYIYGTELYITH